MPTELLDTVLSERVKDAGRVLETMESFGRMYASKQKVVEVGTGEVTRNSPNDFLTPRQRQFANF